MDFEAVSNLNWIRGFEEWRALCVVIGLQNAFARPNPRTKEEVPLMAVHRLHSYFEPASFPAPQHLAAGKSHFTAAPLGICGGGLPSWQANLYAWAKSRAVADVATESRSRRIWSVSQN
jgi:hypothetical protein